MNGNQNKALRKLILKLYMIHVKDNDIICGKCRVKCHRSLKNPKTTIHPSSSCTGSELKSSEKTPKFSSPRNIKLPIPSTGSSHGKCFVCKTCPKRLIVISRSARYDLFLKRGIIVPYGSRCCGIHIENDGHFTIDAAESIVTRNELSSFNRTDIKDLLESIRETANKNSQKRIDFDSPDGLSNEDCFILTGLNHDNFVDICSHIKPSALRDTNNRSYRACIGIFLTKLRSGMSNKMLSAVFNIGKDSVRRAITSARNAIVHDFVPSYLGFQHVSRKEVIEQHTRPLAQTLFGGLMKPAILVIDGTYIYIQKSGQFRFQRRSYSTHKHRSLVKPMMFVTTSGYIVSVIGPYYSDAKNNDSSILNQILKNNVEEIREWLNEDDVVVVDRGFRDSVELLNEFGIHSEMPAFSKKKQQHPTEESNASRLVTKIR